MFKLYKLDLIFGAQTDKSELKKVDAELSALYKKYSGKKIEFGITTKDASKKITTTTTNLNKMDTALGNVSKSTTESTNRMKTAIRSTIEWSVAVGGFYSVVNKIKDSFLFTGNIDRYLTEISMVTQQTREDVADLKDEYLELGRAIQTSTEELAKSAVALYRQGLSADEVNARLGEIAKTAKVAGISVDEVTRFVTSGVNAMKVSAQEFNDVLLKVGAVAATDYQKIATSLQKSAVSFTSAGYSLEKAAGTIAVIQEVTQESSESIGSSLKTILARFNKLTEEGLDNTEVLNGIDKALQSVNITLQDSDGQFRDTAIVLDELGAKWQSLDRNTQNYILTEVAGVRQAERARVLLENYGRSLEITDQAMQAAGTTAEQYAKYQESIEGKLNAITNAWERLYGQMVDSGTVGEVLDSFKEFVETLIVLEDNFGILNAVLAITIPLLIAMKGELIATKTIAFGTFVYNLIEGIRTLGVTAGIAAAGISTLKLVMGGVAGAIGLIIGAHTLLAKKHADFIQDTKEANTELNTNIEEWNRLNEVQKENIRLNALLTTQKLAEDYEEAKEKISEVTDQIERLKAIMEPDSGVTYTTNLVDDFEEAIEKQKEYNLIIETYEKALGIVNGSLTDHIEGLELLNTRTEQGIDMQEYWETRLNATKEATDEVAYAVKSLSDAWHESTDRIDDMIKGYDSLTEAEKSEAESLIKAEIAKTEQMKASVKDRIKLMDAEFEAMMNMLLFGSEPLTDQQLLAFKKIEEGVRGALNEIESLNVTITDWQSKLDSITKSNDSLNSSIKEVTESYEDLTSQIESENIKAIERYRDTIIEALDEEKEALDRNKDAWERDFEDRKLASDRYYEDLMDSLDSETDTLKDNRDIQDEIATIQEKQLSLMKLQDELLDAKNQRNVRILTASGWQWIANPDEIKRINDEISSVEDELAQAKLDQERANQDRAREATKRHYEQQKLIAQRAFEDEKLIVERGYEDQFNIIDDYLDEIKDLELTNYNARLMDLNNFVNSYNSKMASIGSTSTISGGMSPSFQSSGGAPTNAKQSTIQQMKLNSAQWGAASPEEKKRLANENLRLGSELGWTRNSAGVWIDEKGQRAYATGGVNDYTGTAMLHGTKARPELVLNNAQSAGLFNFIKGLSGFNSNMLANKTPVSSGGDTYHLSIMAPNNATLSGLLTQAKQMAKHGRR